MILKRVICGFCFILLASHAASASAEISLAYEHYLSEGIKAFENRDDEKAIGFFKRAHLINPSAKEPGVYLMMIQARQPVVEHGVGRLTDGTAPEQQDYGRAVVAALDRYEQEMAQGSDIKVASVPSASAGVTPSRKPAVSPDRMKVITETLDRMTRVVASGIAPGQVAVRAPRVSRAKEVPNVLRLEESMGQGDTKPRLQLELGASVILEGRNIQRFLIVDEGFIEVTTIGRDQVRITARKVGRTYLHIWDNNGRWTFLVENVLPRSEGVVVGAPDSSVLEHANPFRFRFSNDWSSYYYGEEDSRLERRSVNYRQDLGISGDTPYGVLDAATSMVDYGDRLEFTYYTLGLSDIPLSGTKAFAVRLFDSSRHLSPLTLPGSYLRGAFADVKLFQSAVALSLTHGKEQSAFGYFSPGYSPTSNNNIINAYQVRLFPDDPKNRLMVNYAERRPADGDSGVRQKAYSIGGEHIFHRSAINAELAHDERNISSLAGWKWNGSWFATAVNFRNIDKDFTTAVTAPANQGEVGALWTAGVNTERFSANTSVDIYRDERFYNPDNRSAFNYDTSAHIRKPIGRNTWSDTNIRYLDTPQEISPRRFASLDTRLTRDFETWGSRRSSVYAGSSYQRSRVPNSVISDYDRYGVVVGARVPLTRGLSSYASYEYSWLHEPSSDLNSNPNVLNAGLTYRKNITERISGNASLNYRKEQDVKGTNSFLAGEDSVGVNIGLTYNPKEDVSYFIDSQARKVWSLKEENPSYRDLDIRFGMRMAWGVPVRWDPSGTISGVVFKDMDRNGRFDQGEPGVPNITVKVGDKEVATDQEGRYSVNIRAKRVMVAPVLESLPPGYMFSQKGFIRVDVLQGRTKRVDFGLTTHTGVYGIVYVDRNGNGAPDLGDQFVRGVKLVLDGVSFLTTDGQGVYFFDDVLPGRHTITLDLTSVPIDLIPLIKLKNEIEVTEGTNYVLHIPMKAKGAKTGVGASTGDN